MKKRTPECPNLDNLEAKNCPHPISRQVTSVVPGKTLEDSKICIICSLCGTILKTF